MSVKLLVFKSDGTRKDIPIKQGVTLIGRGEDVQLRLSLGNISRHHCELKLAQGQLTVRDLQSANGTRVNSQQVNQAVLRPGDQLAVGPVTFIVQVDGEPSDPAPVITQLKPTSKSRGKTAKRADLDLSASRPEVTSEMKKAKHVSRDPIAALEALAQQDEDEDDPFKRL